MIRHLDPKGKMNAYLSKSFLFVLFSILPFLAFSQITFELPDGLPDIEGGGTNISTTVEVNLPDLEGVIRADSVQPFYRHLYIFGDGSFRIGELADSVSHTYFRRSDGSSGYNMRVTSTGHYSGGEEPPQLQGGPVNLNFVSPINSPIDTQRVIDEGEWIRIQRNEEIVPGESAIHVVSVTNRDVDNVNATLLFLYGSKVRRITETVRGNVLTEVLDDNAEFEHNITTAYDNPFTEANYFQATLGDGDDEYDNILAYELFNMTPNREYRFFIEMTSDEGLMDSIPGTSYGEVDFLAMLYTYPLQVQTNLSDDEQEAINAIDLPGMVSLLSGKPADVLYEYNLEGDSTSSRTIDIGTLSNMQNVTGGPGPQLMDVAKSTAQVVKAHDPNYIKGKACACADEGDIQQVIFKVHCENDGYAPATNIYMDVILPEGILAQNVIPTPLDFHPQVSATDVDNIELVILDDNRIRWRLNGFQIDGIPVHGPGHPLTYADLSFRAFTDQPVASLDSIQAIVRFNTEDSEGVYTPKAKIELVVQEKTELLECGPCPELAELEFPDDSFFANLPWWLWLIIALILILILYFWLRS